MRKIRSKKWKIQRAAKLRSRHRARCLVNLYRLWTVSIDFWCSGHRKYCGVPTMARRIAGWPADFWKSSRVLFWGPGVVKIGFLAKKYSDFTYFHNFVDRFLKNQNFRKIDFFKNWLFFHFWSVFRRLGASKSNAAWKNTSRVLFWDFLAWWEAHWCPAKVQDR